METSYEKFEYDDFVFENRNKGFGAYELRESYFRRLIILSVIIFFVYIVGAIVLSWLTSRVEIKPVVPKKKNNDEKIVDVALDTKKPEPPPLKVEIPKVKMVKYVPPKIVKDKEVQKEELPPKQKEMEKINPGDENNPDGDDGDLPPPSGNGDDPLGKVDDEIYDVVEEDPEFIGDYAKYLNKNIVYPKKALKMELEGSVYVSFVVEKDGSISNAKVIKGMPTSEECNQEALRVIKIMPKWKPGKAQGKAVRTIVKLPIKFVIPDYEDDDF